MKGIDVSYANDSINWSKVKSSGVEFAIIRSSFGSDLPSQIDNQYYQNASGCVKNRIPFGIYHFAYFVDTATAKQEAAFAIRLAKEYKEYVKFIALDIEEDSERYAHRVGKYPDWTSCAITFMEAVREAGFLPILYSNQGWLTSQLDYNKVKGYKLWYAAPGASSPKYACALWQYDWKGKINGINGDVDVNLCYDEALFANAKEIETDKTKENAKNSGAKDKPTNTQTAQKDKSKSNTNEVFQVSSAADVNYSVRVSVPDGLNVRQGASVNFKVLTAIPYGKEVHISKATSGDGYLWGLTEYNGIKGWIALNYTTKIKKSVYQLALEVIRGEWGAGDERERRLNAAGYSYKEVQAKVNELMK